MMEIPKLGLVFTFVLISTIGCSYNSNKEVVSTLPSTHETVTANVIFRASSAVEEQPLSDVDIVIVDHYGKVIDTLVTNDKGEVDKDLIVQVDPKYEMKRGTVTVIASKKGYRDAVILETPVSEGSAAQPFHMEPILPDERNEPTVELGNNHRLEIISLVDKYKVEAKPAR